MPFGYKAVPRDEYSGREDIGTGPLGVIGNIVWLLLAGWWLALGHLVTAILLAVTIMGVPFAWAHLKLAGLALWPIGKAIVRRRTRRSSSLQRYTKTGVFVCVRTLFVTLPSTIAESPPRPCDPMTMRSQRLSEAAAIMA
jgi:inner membrane component-like transport protein